MPREILLFVLVHLMAQQLIHLAYNYWRESMVEHVAIKGVHACLDVFQNFYYSGTIKTQPHLFICFSFQSSAAGGI